jgi:hypothetical protein
MHTFTRRLSRMHCICRAPRCGDGQGCPRHQSTHVRKLALAFSYLLQLCHGLRLQHSPHVISGTSKARRTTYGHVMNIATLPDPGARLDREKTPVRRLRETPQVQSTGHLGQLILHHGCRSTSNCGRCGPLVRQPHEMALR